MAEPLTETQRRAVVRVLRGFLAMDDDNAKSVLLSGSPILSRGEVSRVRAAANMALIKLERRDD